MKIHLGEWDTMSPMPRHLCFLNFYFSRTKKANRAAKAPAKAVNKKLPSGDTESSSEESHTIGKK